MEKGAGYSNRRPEHLRIGSFLEPDGKLIEISRRLSSPIFTDVCARARWIPAPAPE